ncbi:hypothetical protein KC343_g2381 [Hortaea werneckii]|uniref:Uncharacterized protein n=1 Tax=Hortaea werneckii TaxID=91943 RepID=A0A3M7GRV9_HORWE|nr:hypothetical protein KC352_g6443 [Hortaea werneckii]KAI7571160.1 hypothetical protein KC317_g1852 [Hortaea werneckii]KAI7625717.1 hypothetical protein KC346_g1602 [Hortaea werneckii]KAI7634477.1 hypothetical protein KC343_g2381 [Hortaea werneckii]KAI7681602.1 hypothetical protein KC319_g1486 [Hortaea werneckii]
MSSLQVLRANGRDRARHVVEIRLHADSDSGQEAVVLRRTMFCPGSNRFFEVQLHLGHDFNLYSSNGVELVISIGDLTHMLIPVTHTQRWVLERPPGGHIAGDYTVNILRIWKPQGGHTDLPLTLPPANPTPGQGDQEANVRDGEFADTGKLVVSIRRFKKLQKDHDATSQPTTIPVQNTDPPDHFFDEWLRQDPKLLREVRRLIIRSDYINVLRGVNGRIYRYVVEIVPDPADITSTPLAHPMGGLPCRQQLIQEAATWAGGLRSSPSMRGNLQSGPSNEERATQFMSETPSFPQTAPSHAGTPGMTPHTSGSFAPNTRRTHPLDLNQGAMHIISHDDLHRADASRSSRRPRNSLHTGPMGSHRGRNGGGDRSDFRHLPPVAPGTEASQTPPASRPAMSQPHGPNDLRQGPQGNTQPETIEIPSSSSDEVEERRKRRRRN